MIADDEVHLHLLEVPESGFEDRMPHLMPHLTEEEVAAAHRFMFERHRLLYAASHAFLRVTLSRYLGIAPRAIEMERDEHGKPELRDRALRFNLSHTLGAALVGVTATADVGVDVERTDRRADRDALAQRVFTAGERAAGPRDAEGFFDRWTLKESYIKARGLGLTLDLQTFGFDLGDAPRMRCERDVDDPAAWQFHSFAPTAAHRAAAAVRIATPIHWLWMGSDL